MGVETTGLLAARYSGVLVGDMNRVAAFEANGMIATSMPAKNDGRSSYDTRPVKWTFARRGKIAGSTFANGPISATWTSARGEGLDRLDVDAFVEHAGVAEDRMRQMREERVRFGDPREMVVFDAARDETHLRP